MLIPDISPLRICLSGLPEKDQAVIQRVITFGASQGKPYVLHPEQQDAHLIIAPDDAVLDLPAGVLVIRVGDQGTLPCDNRLLPPLLVTRVMRILDDTLHRFAEKRSTPAVSLDAGPATVTTAPSQTKEVVSFTSFENATQSVAEVTPTPASAEAATQDAVPDTVLQRGGAATGETGSTYPPENPWQGYTALVVDDSAAIRKQLELELRGANIRADFAETGEEALEKSAQNRYDLIFLDIVMPGIDGYEVCRQMRMRPAMKKTPIIMLSGKTSPLDEVKGVIAGASTYLTKPVKPAQFQQTLKRVSAWLSEFSRQR